jgi:hypothetical protein|tara:strand:+ start:7745 stop:8752 length:1008 start_codon:yes stop_codon:yes gene_type:complete
VKIINLFIVFVSIILNEGTVYHDNKTDKVTTSNRQLLVNNVPYFIKGVCYHPVPKGSTKRSFSKIDQDLNLMGEAGINTIRVYEPIDQIEILNKIDQAGIKVIISFGFNQGGNYDIYSGTFIDYINKFKNHNAILFWELGNEYNYHPEWFGGDLKNWYDELNKSALIIKENDKNHPVATAHGELPNSKALSSNPNIDIWGLNVYRWDDPSTIFKQWELLSDKPVYLSESGADSYMTIEKDGYSKGENQKAQADANSKIIDAVFQNSDIVSGLFIFSFLDGLWKAGNPDKQDVGGWAPNSMGIPYDGAPNEEFWGILDIERNKKETFNVLKEKFNK